jgi:hypothetical protein
MESSYNEAEYDADGELADVPYKEYYEITESQCMVCESTNIEGKL